MRVFSSCQVAETLCRLTIPSSGTLFSEPFKGLNGAGTVCFWALQGKVLVASALILMVHVHMSGAGRKRVQPKPQKKKNI
ncbi:hypothetical protein XELAEV_18021856mg [Xenopus laevis]|uniref:Uncharacterized protein n=1 Tax=Xenopus laevis TaxID=8355 RepID=A0A974D247_XENLA|nr:hypothetical protein XELAEV_18021856mg [Xenopus laevis]